MYRLMYLSRRTDDREVLLKKQQKTYFQMSSAGHEALTAAAGLVLRSGYDWFYPYYRDRALCLALGVTVEQQLLQGVGAATDVTSGGRMMPSHWGNRALHIVSQSSPTGTQCLQAVGCAEAGRYFSAHPGAAKAGGDYRQFHDVQFHPDELVYVSLGEGATSQGEFWEALNTASNLALPVLFVVEDNEYAISVPVEVNTAGGNISRIVANFPNFLFAEIDGADALVSYEAFEKAAAHCRSGKGPAFIHGHVTRPHSHSTSDDERAYRHEREIRADALLDPLPRLRNLLLEQGVLDREAAEKLEASVEAEIDDAVARALAAPLPEAGSAQRHIYSEDLSPCAGEFSTEAEPSPDAGPGNTPLNMVQSINRCLRDEMLRDERIVAFGEDVADCSRPAKDGDAPIKGKGGVFGITLGLQREFGSDRVFNTPLAEANIMGRTVGYATRGMKPVVEIQFMDYIWPAMQQLRNELSLMRWRSNGAFAAPAVIRVTVGGYVGGGGAYHSQTCESTFTHIPGLRVVCPSNATDANGLMRTAIRCDDPVLFLEHKHLYRDRRGRGLYPGPNYMIPFGKAAVARAGERLTIVTFGALVPKALEAAARAETEYGISVEVIDLRSLNPYDWETISTSIGKTNRVIVAHEDMLSWGYGAEIAARIADELFHHLDAPVKRVGGRDSFVAYQPLLENAILPQVDDLVSAIRETAAY
jgi:2-oxoisovalerate dehydrogenase E1 component